jgi:molecular chaperone DnaJ
MDREKSQKGKDVIVTLEISFMESIQGCTKTVSFERVSVCQTCNGSRCRPGTSPTQCSNCQGSGRMFYKQGYMSLAMECSACNGEGKTVRNPCMTCYGKGVVHTNVKESISIPKGVDEKMSLRLQKKGNYSTSGQHGDLYVQVKIKPHTYFKRDQFDIYTTNYISVSQAALGGKIKVRTLYGEVTVNVDPGTNDGDTKKLINYGITKLPPNQSQKGHHFIKFKIIVPNKLSEQQKKVYEELSRVEDKINQSFGDD